MNTEIGIKRIKIALFIGMSLLLIASGCGKNTMGPSAPKIPDAQIQADDELTDAESANLYSITCYKKGAGMGHRSWIYTHLLNFNPLFVLNFCGKIADGYLGDHDSKATMRRIATSRLFNIIVFKHGLGFFLYDRLLTILSNAWSPDPRENPNEMTTKVTLLPREWRHGRGFYGEFHDGWEPLIGGEECKYRLESQTPDGKKIAVFIGSFTGNVVENEKNIENIRWIFQGSCGWSFGISMRFYYLLDSNPILAFASTSTFINEDGSYVWFPNIWASTKNKGGECAIQANNGTLELELHFNELGVGGGFMMIRNVHGQMDRYDYVVESEDHGYWTKNDGRKHRF